MLQISTKVFCFIVIYSHLAVYLHISYSHLDKGGVGLFFKTDIIHALKQMYDEYAGEEIMEKKCLKLFNEVEGVIREPIAESISGNIENKRMKTI